jgi:hypothetical protein
MSLDRWDEVGDLEQTEHWRSILPEFSVADGGDLTGISNSFERVAAIRQHYVLAFKHLTGPRGSWHGGTGTGLTRVCDWTALTERERTQGRPGSAFGLCRGVPSELAPGLQSPAGGELDFAIRVTVPPTLLPAGLLILEGVPMVVHRYRGFRPLPINADELWPPEPPIPDYLATGARSTEAELS